MTVPSALIATAVCDPLCGSIPMICTDCSCSLDGLGNPRRTVPMGVAKPLLSHTAVDATGRQFVHRPARQALRESTRRRHGRYDHTSPAPKAQSTIGHIGALGGFLAPDHCDLEAGLHHLFAEYGPNRAYSGQTCAYVGQPGGRDSPSTVCQLVSDGASRSPIARQSPAL